MTSTVLISLVCAAAITFGAEPVQQVNGGGKEFCATTKNIPGNLLAYGNCTLACNGTEPAKNTTAPAPNHTQCMYTSQGEENAVHSSGQATAMTKGTCMNGTCTLTENESSNSTMTLTTKITAVTTAPSTHTMKTSMATSNGSSHATGTTMAPTASHNGTTMDANKTTTEKPPSAASPSTLLGVANQAAIVTVLALAVFGRSP